MPVSDTPNTAPTHLEAEVRAIVRVLRSYGALPKAALNRLVGAHRWRRGDLGSALEAAIAQRRVRHLGAGFYEARGANPPTDGTRRPSR
jgi:hypothetical protein